MIGTELCSRPRAAQKSLAGRMRPAGRVFETPELDHFGRFPRTLFLPRISLLQALWTDVAV